MKRFAKDHTYRIGELKTGANPRMPAWKANRYLSFSGAQMAQADVSTLTDFWEQNPLNLKEGKNYHIYVVDDETGAQEYFGEGAILLSSKPPGLADSAPSPLESPTPPGRGGGSSQMVEVYKAAAEHTQSEMERAERHRDSLLEELRSERSSKEALINRLIESEQEKARLQQRLEIELQMLRLEQNQQVELAKIRQEQAEREAARTSLADDLNVAGMIQAAFPYVLQGIQEWVSSRRGGSAPQYAPQQPPPMQMSAPPAGGMALSDQPDRNDLGMQKVEPLAVSAVSQAESRM